MTIIFRQCNKATKTKISFRATYNADCQAGNIIEFLKRVRTVCFRSDNGGLSFGPYKQNVAVESMNNYSNNKPHDPNGFKEKVKIKYNAVEVVVGRFPNKTATMMKLLGAAGPAIDWTGYCQLPPDEQLTWKEKDDDLNKVILFLMNSKNNNDKKNLCLVYSQGNMTAHPLTIESMVRYLSTQYPNKNSAYQHKCKKRDRS